MKHLNGGLLSNAPALLANSRHSRKHSSLIRKFLNYGQKKFNYMGPWSKKYRERERENEKEKQNKRISESERAPKERGGNKR